MVADVDVRGSERFECGMLAGMIGCVVLRRGAWGGQARGHDPGFVQAGLRLRLVYSDSCVNCRLNKI